MTSTVYPEKYAHGFCFAVLCCGYTLTDFPISIRLTSLALWQSNDCPSASKATLMNMDKYLMWIHYEWLHNHNKAKHNRTVCIFLGIYCSLNTLSDVVWSVRLVGIDINLTSLYLYLNIISIILYLYIIMNTKLPYLICISFTQISELITVIASVHVCYNTVDSFSKQIEPLEIKINFRWIIFHLI